MKKVGETGSRTTGEVDISIHVSGLHVQIHKKSDKTTVKVNEPSASEGSPAPLQGEAGSSYTRAASSAACPPSGFPYSAAARAASSSSEVPLVFVSDDQTKSDVVTISDDESGFELVGSARQNPVPFFQNPTDPELPPALKAQACRLSPEKNVVDPGNEYLCDGLLRIELAYEAGRQASRFLRGDDGSVLPSNFKAARSPRVYVVLKGGDSATDYPCSCKTFAAYKTHVFEDHFATKPIRFRRDSVSRGFLSEIEARAYCYGAGLQGVPKC
jgi:hypothetical protein